MKQTSENKVNSHQADGGIWQNVKANEMKIIMIPEVELINWRNELKEMKESLSKKNEGDFASSYIESKRIPHLLGISAKTWQTYRDKGYIPFIQFGSKIWVKRVDLDAFLNQHYIKKSA
jgi:hypothetical protein